MNLGFGPRERLGVNIVGFDEGVDVGHQFLTRVERGAGQRLGRQDRKPYFDLIEPGRLGRRKVKVDVRVPFQPTVIFGLVSVEIVENNVDPAAGMLSNNLVS